MALVDVRGDFDVLRLGGLEGGFDIGLQGRLIAFDGEQVIRADVADGSWRFRDCRRSRRWSRRLKAAAEASFSSRMGMAVVSLDLWSTASCPRTRCVSEAKAETRCKAARALVRSWLRRTLLPSMAIVSGDAGQHSRTQSRKQAANSSGSIRFIGRFSQRPDGTPQS